MISAVVASAGLALDITQTIDIGYKWWPLVAFGIFIGLVVGILYGLYTELREIKTTIPRLVLQNVESPIKDIAKITFERDGSQKLIGVPTFARIWISNEPRKPELGVTAENVYAKIEFLDRVNQKTMVSMSGRWPEAGQPQGSLKTQQMNIPPNNKPFCLDIAMKYPEDDETYGYDDLAHQRPDGRNPKTKLNKGVYSVKVTLACKGVNLPLWFQLNNQGKGHDISFSEINSW